MAQSENINELASALAKAQLELRDAQLNAKAQYGEYADLESILNVLRPILGKHGLSFTQIGDIAENNFVLITTLMHSSGQWIQSAMPIKVDLTKPQAVGSALTYLRRYSLTAVCGITSTDQPDDDGNIAQDAAVTAVTNDVITTGQVKYLENLLSKKPKLKESIAKKIPDLSKLEVTKFPEVEKYIKEQLDKE